MVEFMVEQCGHTNMMILGCPEKRQKTHAQQVMEPSVTHQCQKQTKKTPITEK
jgi:hypothetical protein